MRTKSFRDYEQFEKEFLGHKAGPMSSAVDEIAEDMYHTEAVEELDAMWDKADDD